MRQREQLDDVMADLRGEHQQIEAPPFLEARLRAAVRETRPAPFHLLWRLSLAMLTILVLGLAVSSVQRHSPKPDLPIEARQEPHLSVPPDPPTTHLPEESPVTKRTISSTRLHKRVHRPPAENVMNFVALPGSEIFPALSEASVLRFQMAKGELRRYGFDVPPSVAAQPIHADFLVGQDGLARAVRIVQ